jgi:hypothetical protein
MTLKELVSLPDGTYDVKVGIRFPSHPSKLIMCIYQNSGTESKFITLRHKRDNELQYLFKIISERELNKALKSKKNTMIVFSFDCCDEHHLVNIKPENFNLISNENPN